MKCFNNLLFQMNIKVTTLILKRAYGLFWNVEYQSTKKHLSVTYYINTYCKIISSVRFNSPVNM